MNRCLGISQAIILCFSFQAMIAENVIDDVWQEKTDFEHDVNAVASQEKIKMVDDASLESRLVEPYNNIVVYNSIKVILMPSTSKQDKRIIMIKGNEELVKQMQIKVAKKTLYISVKYQSYQQGNPLTIICFVDKLNQIIAEDGAYIKMDVAAWSKPLTTANLMLQAYDHAKIIIPKLRVAHLTTIVKNNAEILVAGWASTHNGTVYDHGILQVANLQTEKDSVSVFGDQGAVAHIWG